jgi:hypothetical protein
MQKIALLLKKETDLYTLPKNLFWNSGLLCLVFWLLVPGIVFSQSATDEQLAFQFLQNKEYDKAIVYYEKFFNKKGGIAYY